MSNDNTPIIIRDYRRKEMFAMDDAYLNGWARKCGPVATLVYLSLCRHANKYQESYPSIAKMAEEHAISQRSIKYGVASLRRWRIIAITKARALNGRWKCNVYTILDKSVWMEDQGQILPHAPGAKNDKKPGAIFAPKGFEKKREGYISPGNENAEKTENEKKEKECAPPPLEWQKLINDLRLSLPNSFPRLPR